MFNPIFVIPILKCNSPWFAHKRLSSIRCAPCRFSPFSLLESSARNSQYPHQIAWPMTFKKCSLVRDLQKVIGIRTRTTAGQATVASLSPSSSMVIFFRTRDNYLLHFLGAFRMSYKLRRSVTFIGGKHIMKRYLPLPRCSGPLVDANHLHIILANVQG